MSSHRDNSVLMATHSNDLHDKTRMLQRILSGKDCLCTHPGLSQYSRVGSSSACGLAAMNCVRYILSLESHGTIGRELVEKMLRKETMDDIMTICAKWTSDSHLEVDDIYKTPLFAKSLRNLGTQFGQAGKRHFESMIRRLLQFSLDHRGSNAVVITRPPEIVACLKIAYPSQQLFVIFDSHPRLTHAKGAAFFFCGSVESAAQYLSNLFPVDERLIAPGSGMQWEAELLAHVSGQFFEFSKNDMQMSQGVEDAFLEATCSILLSKTQESDARARHAQLASDNERLKKDLELMDHQVESVKHEKAALTLKQEEVRELEKALQRRSFGSHPGLFPSGLRDHRTAFNPQNSPDVVVQLSQDYGGSANALSNFNETSYDGDYLLPDNGLSIYSSKRMGKMKASNIEGEDDLEMAFRIQMDYQAEDTVLIAQMQQLQSSFVQQTFDCSICIDQLPIDDIARLDGCEHTCCRGCLRQYITSKLNERKFPMPCPCCAADRDGTGKGVVSEALIHQIGICEEAYKVFNELQIAKFSIAIECRKCRRSAFVDKQEFAGTKLLFCPFPNCSYCWCKDCQQEISTDTDGPIHSCDGSEELTHLMHRRGWKHCPGCRTPTEKTEGCNHMTCGSPGCNTHFCYTCGTLIIKSSQRSEINERVRIHYRAQCSLFHVPPEEV